MTTFHLPQTTEVMQYGKLMTKCPHLELHGMKKGDPLHH